MTTGAAKKHAKLQTSLVSKILLPFKLIILGIIFATGCLSIVYSQFLTKLFVKDEETKQWVLDFTKKNFVTLLTFMTTYFSSATTISLSFPDEEFFKRAIKTSGSNRGKLTLDQSAIIIANHQIYSDWLYLWFIAYLNNCHDHIFIIMKDSLKRIPILGYGMANYNFVFLSRKWESDFLHMKTQFDTICSISNKAWMLIFPEGTNINDNHLKKSQEYAPKVGGPILQTVLLPRVKGLYLALKELSPATSKIIDFTIGYSDHSIEEQAQDIFTLYKVYIEGQSPKKISVLVREYDMVKEVPKMKFQKLQTASDDEIEEKEMEALQKWIFDKWEQKDNDLKYFYNNGDFGDDKFTVDIPLKLNSPWELVLVYCIPFNSFLMFFLVYKGYLYLLNSLLG